MIQSICTQFFSAFLPNHFSRQQIFSAIKALMDRIVAFVRSIFASIENCVRTCFGASLAPAEPPPTNPGEIGPDLIETPSIPSQELIGPFTRLGKNVFDCMALHLSVRDLSRLARVNKIFRKWAYEALHNQVVLLNNSVYLDNSISVHIHANYANLRKMVESTKQVWFGIMSDLKSWPYSYGLKRSEIECANSRTFAQLNSYFKYGRALKIEYNLVTMFERIPDSVFQNNRPVFNGNLNEEAAAIRDWMKANQDILNRVDCIKIQSSCFSSLPPEIMQFRNLKALFLNRSHITHLPENFHLPELRILYLSDTRLTHLPENLNLPKLYQLSLDRTKLACLPDNLNLPRLDVLSFWGTGITRLPPNLRRWTPQLSKMLEIPSD